MLGIRVKYLAKHDVGLGGLPERSRPPRTRLPHRHRPRRTRQLALRAPARASVSAAAAPVTEWAVASIPTGCRRTPVDPAPSALGSSLAVDDEPEEAATESARVRTATLAPVREGDVLPAADVEPSFETDDDESETESDLDVPVPPVVVPPLARASQTRSDGVQRYGEAVVRQVLGATFVREEPYEPPTRFN